MPEKKRIAKSKRPESEYHDEYYCSREIQDEELVVKTTGFRESLEENPIGELYRCLLEKVGDPQGRSILDYGCGTGQVGVFFALSGANVRGFDISEKGVQVATRRARINGVSASAIFEAMQAESLRYKDEQFDFVVGRWILHHLDKKNLSVCGKEMKRVLKKGGKALFIEPLGHNVFIEFVRRHAFYSDGDYASEHESTMKQEDVLAIGEGFHSVLVHEFHLFYMLKRVIGNRKILRVLKSTDNVILRMLPFLRRFCGECVIEFSK